MDSRKFTPEDCTKAYQDAEVWVRAVVALELSWREAERVSERYAVHNAGGRPQRDFESDAFDICQRARSLYERKIEEAHNLHLAQREELKRMLLGYPLSRFDRVHSYHSFLDDVEALVLNNSDNRIEELIDNDDCEFDEEMFSRHKAIVAAAISLHKAITDSVTAVDLKDTSLSEAIFNSLADSIIMKKPPFQCEVELLYDTDE
jgi:hypothetical protein